MVNAAGSTPNAGMVHSSESDDSRSRSGRGSADDYETPEKRANGADSDYLELCKCPCLDIVRSTNLQ